MSDANANPTPPPPIDADEFYVGYLPAPRSYAKFARRAAEALAALAIVAALAIAAAQSRPGPGAVTDSPGGAVSRGFFDQPVPLCLFVDDKGVSRWLLIVGERKFGAASVVSDMPLGLWREARGNVIGAPGGSPGCFELAPATHSLRLDVPAGAAPVDPTRAAPTAPLGRLTLRGQIIDPKCHFGAMKPGEGKVHRACAVRCISGGIPPVLMVRERAPDGAERLAYYILTDTNGKPVNDAVLDYVAENVEITGEASRLLAPDGATVGDDSLRVLRFDPGSIKRLP